MKFASRKKTELNERNTIVTWFTVVIGGTIKRGKAVNLDEEKIGMNMSVDLKKHVEWHIVLSEFPANATQSNRLSEYSIIYFNLIQCIRAITSRAR